MSTTENVKINVSQAGTWFISYLCEIGYITNYNEVFGGHGDGTLLKDLHDIKKGSRIHIYVDNVNPCLFHIDYIDSKTYLEYEDYSDMNNDIDVWWEHFEDVKHTTFEFNLPNGQLKKV